jgi:hypothetical protein
MDSRKYFDFAKTQKETWNRHCSKDMPPFIIIEREGVPLLMVMAPQVDKNLALKAALLCRKGFACDAITFVADCHMFRPPVGLSPEESRKLVDDVREKYGSYQDAFKQGVEGVTESLSVVRCKLVPRVVEGKVTFISVAYESQNKDVIWGEETTMEDGVGGARFEGNIPSALRAILKEPSILEMKLMRTAAEKLGLDGDPERQLYHGGRAIRKILHMENFLIMECVKWKEEEGEAALRERVEQQFEDIKDVYDLEKMETSDLFWDKYWPGMN